MADNLVDERMISNDHNDNSPEFVALIPMSRNLLIYTEIMVMELKGNLSGKSIFSY